MEFVVIGITVAFNIIVVLWKLRSENRKLDGLIDGTILVAVAIVFSGSQGALVMGTIGSLLVSIYLLIKPIELSRNG